MTSACRARESEGERGRRNVGTVIKDEAVIDLCNGMRLYAQVADVEMDGSTENCFEAGNGHV